ncbi:MAG TPA: bifunctional riboflavin kinase/FAD synthetase [Clostridia bacterium]|nr:bifunctional riboflavin kinase/FAD synthetase [Clostridia bacterium]
MLLIRKLEDIPSGFSRSVVTVGNFDGLHRAHCAVIDSVVRRARELDARSVVLTFDPHPIRILRPREAPPLLTPMPMKLRLLEKTGIDFAVVLPFSRDLSMMPPYEFAETILSTALRAVEIHEGFNFRFGHKAEGDAGRLREFGRKLGFDVVSYDPLTVRGKAVSSSQVRKLVQAGDVVNARHLLGRAFSILATPGRGRGYGTKYTVPTINLARYDELVPKDGVYITQITVNGETFDSVTNVGQRPTFGSESFAIETHILNFHPVELTAETPVELAFLKRLRDEVKFPSVPALKEQISRDVKRAQRYFQLMHRFGKK